MPQIHDTSYAWFRLLVTLVIAIFANTGMWAVITIMPALEAEFATSRATTSLPFTMNMIGFALGNLVIGRIIDRIGVTLSVMAAAILSATAFLLSTLTGDIYLLAAVHLFLGFGTAAGFGPLITDISHWFLKQRGIAVALIASGNYLAGGIWPLFLSDILAEDGWRTAYLMLAVITLCVILPLALLLQRKLPEAGHQIAAQQVNENIQKTRISPLRLQLLLCVAGVACCVAMSMPQVRIVAFCVDLGYGPAVGGQMLSLMLLGGVVSRLISGLVADRLGGVMTLLIGSALQCLALFLYLPSGGMTSLYIVSLVFGLAQGGIVPSYALVVREYMPSAEAGRWVGFVLMSTIFGMALGGWMSGWIYDVTGSYHMAFVNGIVWNFLNIGIMVMILMRTRPRRPEAVAA